MKINQNFCILICYRSDCWLSGNREIYQRLQAELCDRGLSDRVQLQKTGCQKLCEKAPNLVIMPNKDRHSYVQLSQVNNLLNRYFQS
ncbi:MAG: (2Fe-2S) ferredoxin domain-containing protein [Pseudanabaena sp.]